MLDQAAIDPAFQDFVFRFPNLRWRLHPMAHVPSLDGRCKPYPLDHRGDRWAWSKEG